MPLFSSRCLSAAIVGAVVTGLLTMVGPSGGEVASAQHMARPGTPREVYLASLYRGPHPGPSDLAGRILRRDREGTFDGQQDAELLRRIRTQPIRRISFNRGGSSLSLRLELSDGSSAAFKPDQTHEHTVPRKEIAAYRLNRYLGLSRVPPASHRVITPKELYTRLAPEQRHLFFRLRKEARFSPNGSLVGQVSWWVPEIRYLPLNQKAERDKWIRWLKATKPIPVDHADMAAQISAMLVFDFLINNPDRFSGNNTMATPDGTFLYFMDNTYSFNPLPQGGRLAKAAFMRTTRFSRSLYRRLQSLDAQRLASLLDVPPDCPWPLLTEEEMEAVIQRRGYAIQRITSIIARHGWERTMVFP